MPVTNAEKFVADAVDSILGQTFRELELLAIEDGSTDRTVEILEGYKDPRVRLLRAPAPGIVPALNFGIEQARAPWIARQDADDISLPRRLESQWKALNRWEDAVFSHTNVEFIGEGRHTVGRARFPRTQAFVGLRLCFLCGIVHSTTMFRKETALAVGGYQRQLAEDYGLWGRLIEQGRFVGVPEKLLQFRIHAASASKRHAEPQAVATEQIALDHCQRFMRLSPAEAKRARAVLVSEGAREWRDWWWFLRYCVPRFRWRSTEMYAWLAWQTFKTLV